MTDAEVERVIRSYLPQVAHMSLGTCREGRPWVCEVHYAYDDELNLYFRSSLTRRHSQDIAANPNVAGNIVTQHFLGQKVRGVYFEGLAQHIPEMDESFSAYRRLQDRFGIGPAALQEAKSPQGAQFYSITVTDWYLFDSYVVKPSQKFHLAWGGEQG